MINFTNKYQFTTRLNFNKNNIELVEEMKILGITILSDLIWNTNTKNMIQKVNKIMQFLEKIQSFCATTDKMVNLWILYCRSIFGQSLAVWSSSFTAENKTDTDKIALPK